MEEGGNARHEPVAEVVDVARNAPPAAHDQPPPGCGCDGLQPPHARLLRVLPKRILLRVGAPEDQVAQRLQRHNAHHGCA